MNCCKKSLHVAGKKYVLDKMETLITLRRKRVSNYERRNKRMNRTITGMKNASDNFMTNV